MTERISVDVVVVGGGPAGLAAGTAAGRAGARVLLIDSFANAGGQYFMQPLAPSITGNRQSEEGQKAIANTYSAGVDIITGLEIVAAYPGFRLIGMGAGRSLVIDARTVIATTGAHDRVMPFPGWTLPGVMTAGAGQRLVKLNGILPGKRVVIAGSGVFLWAVAANLLEKGAQVIALVEARKPSVALAFHLLSFPERWAETMRLYRSVAPRIGRLIYGRMIARASGTNRIEKISLADARGVPRETLDGFDALLVGHGFQPNIEVTSLLDCMHRFDDALGGWHAIVDEDGHTSIPGLFAAGELTGIAGAQPAALSGEIAGLAAVARLGFPSGRVDDYIQHLKNRLTRARRFGQGLGRLFSPLLELDKFATDDTILCRCEEITKADITAAVQDGSDTVYTTKIWTRAGMGRCQGRICRMGVTACIAQLTGLPKEQIGFNRPRIPSRPTNLADALSMFEEAARR